MGTPNTRTAEAHGGRWGVCVCVSDGFLIQKTAGGKKRFFYYRRRNIIVPRPPASVRCGVARMEDARVYALIRLFRHHIIRLNVSTRARRIVVRTRVGRKVFRRRGGTGEPKTPREKTVDNTAKRRTHVVYTHFSMYVHRRIETTTTGSSAWRITRGNIYVYLDVLHASERD